MTSCGLGGAVWSSPDDVDDFLWSMSCLLCGAGEDSFFVSLLTRCSVGTSHDGVVNPVLLFLGIVGLCSFGTG